MSDKYGLTIWLCREDHTGDSGIHFNKALRLRVQAWAQGEFIKVYGYEKFMQIFGTDYVEKYKAYCDGKTQ